MPVNLEVKGTLAKLLASEDLVVEHREVRTASFDVNRRVLTLPVWKVSNNILDVLVAHEVGHALFTPNMDWRDKCKVPKQFLNICEDIRVEKLMKRKYLGIGKSFYRGYGELNEIDFFDIEGVNLDTFNLADKVNLHFKIGPFLGIKFTPQEQEIVNVVENTETFEDALAAAEALYNYCEVKQHREKKGEEVDQECSVKDSKDSRNNGTNNSSSNESSDSNSGGSSSMEDRSSGDADTDRVDDNGPTIETAKSFADNLEKTSQVEMYGYTYIERPKFPLKDVIIKSDYISDFCEDYWDTIYAKPLNKWSYLDEIDDRLLQYKKSAQKEVNYLVKEFECRKSASAYSRAGTNRTGVLDTTKLQTYKFNEDIFKKVTVLPDGKNHGLIFLLDWSGSMHDCLEATVKQLLNLVWFCKKVNIPFRVYGFTNCYYDDVVHTYDDIRSREDSLIEDPEVNSVWIDKSFRLLEFLTSDGTAKEFERQVRNFWRITTQNNYGLDIPQRFLLSGTPLNVALLSLHDIIPLFKEKYGVEKIQTVILTDGESEPVAYACRTENPRTLESKIFKRSIRNDRVYLRDRKVGSTYKLAAWIHQTSNIMKNLQDNFSDVNFIGIRLAPNKEFRKFISLWGGSYDSLYSEWKKDKSVALDIGNFTKFFALSINEMNKDVEFEVEENATKSQIKSAFKKSLNKSKFNRKILSEFVELVA